MIQNRQSSSNLDEYDFSALEQISPKRISLNEALREVVFYLLPILGTLFFLFVLFQGVIPTLREMNEGFAEIERLKQEDITLQARIDRIIELERKIAETQEVIDKINILVPTGKTEVVAFGERIIFNISNTGLTYEELKTGELEHVNTLLNTEAQDESMIDQKDDPSYLPLYQLPTMFDLDGPYESIRAFFKNIYSGDDFFVVDEMELVKVSENEWSGDISLAKYQFTPNNAFDPNKAYLGVSEETPLNQEVLDFLQKKFVDNAFDKSGD